MSHCTHGLWERESAVADGYCPLCMAADPVRAAAPDMLEALKAYEAAYSRTDAIPVTTLDRARELARAAIAKAEGKS